MGGGVSFTRDGPQKLLLLYKLCSEPSRISPERPSMRMSSISKVKEYLKLSVVLTAPLSPVSSFKNKYYNIYGVFCHTRTVFWLNTHTHTHTEENRTSLTHTHIGHIKSLYCTFIPELLLEVHGSVNGDSYRCKNRKYRRWKLHVGGTCPASVQRGKRRKSEGSPGS